MIARRPVIWIHALLIIIVALTLYPIIFMLTNAMKSGYETAVNPFSLPFHPTFSNFAHAWHSIGGDLFRSTLVVSISVVGILLFALLSAYAFARLDFPAREPLFYLVFALLLVPAFLTLIPLFLEIRNLGLFGSVWGLILPYIAAGQAFAIFVLRTFVKSIPNALFEAATIDGASDIQMFVRFVVPLSVPILITLALLNVVGLWSDYIFPSLILSSDHQTVAVAIANFQPPADAPSLDAFNIQLAAFTLASIPMAILFLFLMRYFIAGITSGAVKM